MMNLTVSVKLDDMHHDEPELHMAQSVHLIAEQIKAGNYFGHGGGPDPDNEWEYDITLAYNHGDYMDGEGNTVHIGHDGMVVSITRPDGTVDESAELLKMDGFEYAGAHGGFHMIHKHEHEG